MRILVISYHFYNRTARGLAIAKVVRGLAERGHELVVIAGPGTVFDSTGDGMELPPGSGIQVVRVESRPELIPTWWRILHDQSSGKGVMDKVVAVPNLLYGCTPKEWGWVQHAVERSRSYLQQEPRCDLMLTVLNPHISHLVGLEITRRVADLPWCAYFSDPWPYHFYPEPYRFTVGPLSRIRGEQLLDMILKRADTVILPSARLRDRMLRNGRSHVQSKAFVAPHMTDVSGQGISVPSGEVFTVRYSGFLMKERRVEPIYEALRRLLTAHPEMRSRLRIEFAGRYQGNQWPEVPEDLGGVIGFSPFMAPNENKQWMQGAHVFLLVEAKLKEGIFFPSKLADYLGGRRPILALSPTAGVVSDMLRSGGGLVVEPDDVEGIARALHQLYTAWTEGRLNTYTPTAEQVYTVSQEGVIPCYEAAFEQAMHHHAGKR